MERKIITLTLLSLLSISSKANESTPVYIWDNQQGLISGEHCSIQEDDHIPFSISTYSGKQNSQTENLRNYNNIRQSHLVIGSLIKEIPGAKKSNYKKIELVGLNQIPNLNYTRWFTERGDQGYLYNRALDQLKILSFQ